MSEMEKLVEEIAEELGGICDPMASYHPSKEEYLRDVARTFIGHIGKAYAKGMKLPGEVGRTEIQMATRITSGLLAFFQTWVSEAITQKKAKILIALRKEEEERE